MVLEASEAAHRKTAARLRSCGQEQRARQVDQFAAWVRFDLDEPLAAQRLYRASARLRYVTQLEQLAERALDNILSLARAEQGNVQLLDPVSGALKIIAQHGFDAAFLDHFALVDDDSSACGRAAGHGAQLVITDVISDPGLAGQVVGVVSTHYPRPYALPARDLRFIKRYADLVGRVLASRVSAVPPAGFAQAAYQPLT
jgi:hypothetical protein